MKLPKIETLKEFCLAFLILWFLVTFSVALLVGFDLDKFAKVGDGSAVFGSITSGLALMVAGYAVWLQSVQLKDARSAINNEHLTSGLTAKLSALPLMIELCNKRLSVIQNDVPSNVFASETNGIISELNELWESEEREASKIDSSIKAAVFHVRMGVATQNVVDKLMTQWATHVDKSKRYKYMVLILEERQIYEDELIAIYRQLDSNLKNGLTNQDHLD